MTNPLISAEQLEIDRQAAEIERLRAELQDILEWALIEKKPLRAQEIASIECALAGESCGDEEPKVPGCHGYEP